MKHRRRNSKRSVRCTLCTTYRWLGNSAQRFPAKEAQAKKIARREIRERA